MFARNVSPNVDAVRTFTRHCELRRPLKIEAALNVIVYFVVGKTIRMNDVEVNINCKEAIRITIRSFCNYIIDVASRLTIAGLFQIRCCTNLTYMYDLIARVADTCTLQMYKMYMWTT